MTAAPATPLTNFPELVVRELDFARMNWGARKRHLEAAAHLRERFEYFWTQVELRAELRVPKNLLHALTQLAAMAQRAAEDLELGRRAFADRQAMFLSAPFPALVEAALPELRVCRGERLETCHAAASWLRYAVNAYDDAIVAGLNRSHVKMLDICVSIAARCQIVCEDLNLIERARQSLAATKRECVRAPAAPAPPTPGPFADAPGYPADPAHGTAAQRAAHPSGCGTGYQPVDNAHGGCVGCERETPDATYGDRT